MAGIRLMRSAREMADLPGSPTVIKCAIPMSPAAAGDAGGQVLKQRVHRFGPRSRRPPYRVSNPNHSPDVAWQVGLPFISQLRSLAGVLQAGRDAVNRKQEKSFQGRRLLALVPGAYGGKCAELKVAERIDVGITQRHGAR